MTVHALVGSRHAARIAAALLVALAIIPAPQALAADPFASVTRQAAGSGATQPDAEARPFRLNLARSGDYVRQFNFVQCVGASVQMMLNIIEPGADRTRTTQRRVQTQARAMSGPRPDGGTRSGAGVFGWAAALNMNGGGRYGVVGADSLDEAMRIAARAMVKHKRPVGLLVWRGRHAWVMSGFEATRNPRDGKFRVTHAYVLDPLNPYGSTSWGRSPNPDVATPVATVGRQFVRRRTHSHWNSLPGMLALRGKYVLVIPTDEQVSFTAQDPYGLLVSAPSLAPRRAAPAPPAAPTVTTLLPQALHPVVRRPI